MWTNRNPKNVYVADTLLDISYSKNAKYLGAKNYDSKIRTQLRLLPKECIGSQNIKVRCIGFDIKLSVSTEDVEVLDFREKGSYKQVDYDIFELALCAGLISK
jgi:hypothetical protein